MSANVVTVKVSGQALTATEFHHTLTNTLTYRVTLDVTHSCRILVTPRMLIGAITDARQPTQCLAIVGLDDDARAYWCALDNMVQVKSKSYSFCVEASIQLVKSIIEQEYEKLTEKRKKVVLYGS